ncbi:MAG: glycosyltransferase family 4 protein [Candidatus Micrarchaeota archaeon]
MKILQVTHLFPPATGGIENYTLNLSSELCALGNELTVFTSALPNTSKEEKINGITVRRFFSFAAPVFSSVRFSPGMFLAMLKSDADIFSSHGYGSLMPFFTAIAAWIKRKPFVFTLHGYPKLNGFSGVFQSFYRLFIASIFLRIAKKVIVVSNVSIKDIEKEVDKSKLIHIPCGVDIDKFNCPSFDNNRTISYIGRLDEYKGIDLLISTFAKFSTKFEEEIKLNIIGKDEGIKEGLVKLTKELNIQDSVSFKEVPYKEIVKEYCNSLAIALPSKYEGFPLVWLEAVASERPIFSTRVGDYEVFYNKIYGKNAELFLFKDETELEKKLMYFLENREKFIQIVKQAKSNLTKEYSWDKIAKDVLEVYKEANE